MKSLLVIIMTAILGFGSMTLMSGCSESVKTDEPHELDGVKVTITDLKSEYNKNTKSTIFEIKFRFDNNSDKDISSINWKKEMLDKEGNVMSSFVFVWLAENEPLHPGESANHEFAWQEVIEGDSLDMIRLSVDSYTTDEEQATVQFPKIGEYLYQCYGGEHLANIKENPPVRIQVVIDHMGAREFADITDPETIKRFVDAFVKIKVLEETQEFVTDNYNGVGFTFSDGKEVYLSLNLKNLEVSIKNTTHMYVLENLGEFWGLCNEYAEYPEE